MFVDGRTPTDTVNPGREDFFETLYRFIRQTCLVVDGRSEERKAQNR